MYNEGRNTFVRDTIIKILLVLLFVFLLIWLFPMPNLNPFYDRIFADNIKSMKEVAKSYYTVERLPKNIGDKEKLTLQEMLDKKMIIPFIDKDGNTCDTINSYVEVVKMDTEYLFKTSLTCSGKTDYVVDYFGCYDVCEGNNCNKVCEKEVKEYEFKKTVDTKYVDHYVCPVGYILSGKNCVKTVENTDTKPATISCKSGYKYNDNTNKCEKTVTDEVNARITCPSGYVYNATSKKCLKSTGETRDAEPSCVAFPGYAYNASTKKCEKPITDEENGTPTCASGYSYNGTSKLCEKATPEEINATPTCASGYSYNGTSKLCERSTPEEINATPTCASGYSYNGTNKLCERSIPEEINATPTCASGYSYNASNQKCEKSVSTAMCPSGYSYNGTRGLCEKAVTLTCGTTTEGSGSYTGWSCSYKNYTTTQSTSSTLTFTRAYITSFYGLPGCSSTACDIRYYKYEECRRSEIMRTVCVDKSYTLSNGVCSKQSVVTATAYTTCSSGTRSGSTCTTIDRQTPNYSCPSGYTPNGTKCNRTTLDQKTPTYVCPSGYSQNGTKCNRTTLDQRTPTYVCPSGYTQNGTKCNRTVFEQKTPTYVCPSGYTQSGTKCYKTVTDQKTPTYSCPAGWTPNGTICNRTTDQEANPSYNCSTGSPKPGDVTKCIVSSTDRDDSYYGCPVSYVLNDKTCYKTAKSDETKDAEAIYKNKTVTQYTWSKTSTLAGWTPTGKTRTSKVPCDK